MQRQTKPRPVRRQVPLTDRPVRRRTADSGRRPATRTFDNAKCLFSASRSARKHCERRHIDMGIGRHTRPSAGRTGLDIQAGTSSQRSASEPDGEKQCRPTCRSLRARRHEDQITRAKGFRSSQTRFRGRSHALMTAGVHTRSLTDVPPLKRSSTCCLCAWEPNPGRSSTYRKICPESHCSPHIENDNNGANFIHSHGWHVA
jgi:hypothetical protein